MDRTAEVLESLIAAYDLMMEAMPTEEATQSGLFDAWLDQVETALSAGGLELDRQMWEAVRGIEVSLTTAKAVQAYGTGMRAVLLGMLHYAENRQEDR